MLISINVECNMSGVPEPVTVLTRHISYFEDLESDHMRVRGLQAKAAADSVFMPGNELSSVKVAVKRLQQGALSDGRGVSKSMSIVGKPKFADAAKGALPTR